jgi:hypothetical protein
MALAELPSDRGRVEYVLNAIRLIKIAPVTRALFLAHPKGFQYSLPMYVSNYFFTFFT